MQKDATRDAINRCFSNNANVNVRDTVIAGAKGAPFAAVKGGASGLVFGVAGGPAVEALAALDGALTGVLRSFVTSPLKSIAKQACAQ